MSPWRRRRHEPATDASESAAVEPMFAPVTVTDPSSGEDTGETASAEIPVQASDASDAEWDVEPTSVDTGLATDVEVNETFEPDVDSLPVTDKRSGRNMVAATTVGLALMALVFTSAWFHPLALAIVLYAACAGAIIEWRRALSHQDRAIPLTPLLMATAGMAVATWFALAEGLAVALLVGCAGVVAWRVVDERIENTMADSLAGILTLLWIPFMGSFFMLMVFADNGWQRVIIVILAIIGNDSGGLYAGMLFGKRPFAPRISPKKTWEGAIGGVVLATVAATVAAYFLIPDYWWMGTIVAVAVAAAATAGDLAESAIKRDMHVKDMSHAIPGHGGIMDRLDSALVAAPVGYLVFAILMGTV